jgi:Glyoxalase-like domain
VSRDRWGAWHTPRMTASVHNITFDCAEPYRLAGFWSQVTGFREDPENPNLPADEEAALIGPEGHPNLLFIRVPEGKTVKNRVHLDLMPTDRTRDEEVARLLGLGATLVADLRRSDGSGWAVLADPEGNELCVERSAAERAAAD